jgi:hypothetical protein
MAARRTVQDLAAAVSELTNALQVALPLAARLREHLNQQTHEADALENALTRAMTAVRHLQPLDGDGR